MATAQSPQSADGVVRVVIDADGSACWEVCLGGECVRDRCGRLLMEQIQRLRQARPLS
jgi:hypothetical protein